MSDRKETTKTIGTPTAERPSSLVIEAVDGPGKGVRGTITAGTFFIGTDPSCDLVLSDDTVSRRHVALELLAGEVDVKDLGSRNGTKYLGARVTTARVPIGGSIKVGKTTLQLQPPTAGASKPSEQQELHGLVGRSLQMRQIFTQLERLGPTDSAVLLRGETGSGKGAAAAVLHALSPRRDKPFHVFDCAAAHAGLLESALFGHVKGSFTGADRDRNGAVDAARGGTLFFDEVGELPLALQPKLLRLLESREYTPVGATQVKKAEVRVISATHRDLAHDVAANRFRKDLYYRLAVAEVQLPPLRDRAEDIPLLAERFARDLKAEPDALAPTTLAAFQCMQWPGNVRELRNAVERLLALGTESLAVGETQEPSFIEARDKALERFEHDYLEALLKQHGGQVSAAARAAKLARSHFYRLLERHGLKGG
ncbi:MAG: sigma 54-dependent Fis family transcriptional regulator [Myxococcaceae bacterium]